MDIELCRAGRVRRAGRIEKTHQDQGLVAVGDERGLQPNVDDNPIGAGVLQFSCRGFSLAQDIFDNRPKFGAHSFAGHLRQIKARLTWRNTKIGVEIAQGIKALKGLRHQDCGRAIGV